MFDYDEKQIESISSVSSFVLYFWNSDFGYPSFLLFYSLEEFKQKENCEMFLMFCREIIHLTYDLIDFGLYDRFSIERIMIGIGYFFSVFEIYNSHNIDEENLDPNTRLDKLHWLRSCASVIAECEFDDIKDKLYRLYEKTAKILLLISNLRHDSQILL